MTARAHVVCRNMACPAPADTWITLTVVAPGVVAYPPLLCAGCGWHLHQDRPVEWEPIVIHLLDARIDGDVTACCGQPIGQGTLPATFARAFATCPGAARPPEDSSHLDPAAQQDAYITTGAMPTPVPGPAAPCSRCEGCGQIADTENGEPWTAWATLPAGSDLAVRLGHVKPIPCPDCTPSGAAL